MAGCIEINKQTNIHLLPLLTAYTFTLFGAKSNKEYRMHR